MKTWKGDLSPATRREVDVPHRIRQSGFNLGTVVTRVRKLVLSGPSGWILLARAQLAVVRATRTVRGRPLGQLYREIARPRRTQLEPDPADRSKILSIGNAVERTARLGVVRGRCLVRSLAIQDLADREGIPGVKIRVGVRMASGTLLAHAWTEWSGIIVGDHPEHVSAFRPLPDEQPEMTGDFS